MTFPVSILAFQSIPPAKVTPPGKSRQISVAGDRLPPSALAAHFRLILYYRPAVGEENSAQAMAAWMKETLSAALTVEPVLAGRLRRSDAESGGWEVRFNDAGVRLVLAAASAEMAEVLDAADREEREWGLVYWRDLERESPHQSALLYVQVTEFKDSGYSIGISCSLLLADPLFLIRFLLQWAHIHRQLTSAGPLSAPLVFYLTNLNPSPLPPRLAAISAAAPPSSTLLFRHPPAAGDLAGAPPAASGNLTFLRSEHAGGVKVGFWGKGGEEGGGGGGGKAARWEELGAGELVLGEKNAPVGVSYRVVPGGDGAGLVVAMAPGGGSDVFVSVTVPVSVSGKC